MSSAESTPKYLVNWKDGTSNLEAASISLILAVTSSKNFETAIFVSGEASTLCIKGAADTLVAPGYEALADLLRVFVEQGGSLWLCPACVKAKGLSESDLLDGVDIAGAPRTMAFLASGGHLLA
ncbi:MAG: DsrE family protein [Pseudomonadales bacterium]|nr:DsrE family protein [Pseudomonadales bacterium]